MSCLSVFRRPGKGAVVAANPIYITSPIEDQANTARLEFEVLIEDASSLSALIGEREHYALGSEWAFWGVLESLEPAESTHPGLGLMRNRRALRGVMTVYPEVGSVN